jgi:denticleless
MTVIIPRIHAHSVMSSDVDVPISYTHPNLRASSFYVKLAISPCNRYLVSGSSNGGVFTWNIGQTTRNRVVMGRDGELVQEDEVTGVEMAWNGHGREVGAVDWGYDQVS